MLKLLSGKYKSAKNAKDDLNRLLSLNLIKKAVLGIKSNIILLHMSKTTKNISLTEEGNIEEDQLTIADIPVDTNCASFVLQ